MTAQPTVVCLCGSARFWREFQTCYVNETLAGHIVLSIAAVPGGDEALFGHLSAGERARLSGKLAALHRHKIKMADEVFVLNVGGYVGPDTARELAYAFLEDERF